MRQLCNPPDAAMIPNRRLNPSVVQRHSVDWFLQAWEWNRLVSPQLREDDLPNSDGIDLPCGLFPRRRSSRSASLNTRVCSCSGGQFRTREGRP